ncbi:MAG TPA: hypothetical protein VJR29_06940 [bacterium]|nr:hypothetical protein [bacterium]
MKKISNLILLLALILGGCASGPGNSPEEENGAAGLSLQLQGLEEGEIYLTNDGYRLTFGHFALAFSAIRLGEIEAQAPFGADFFDEEVVDVVEIEEVPAGEYDGVALTLGLAEAGQAQRFLRARGLKNAEGLPPSLAGLSVFLEAAAANGGDACTLQVALAADGETIDVDPAGQAIEVHGGEEAEILVEVDPNAVFAGVDLGALCQGDTLVTISAAENSELAEQIAANLSGAFLLGSTEGHSHSH